MAIVNAFLQPFDTYYPPYQVIIIFIIRRWQRWFAKYLNIDEMQQIFLRLWKGYFFTTSVWMSDATVY